MTEEDAKLWQEEQLAFIREAQEETRRFAAEQHVLIAEAQRQATVLQQALGLNFAPRYSLAVVAGASLGLTIAAVAGSVVGLALCRVVAAQCAGTTPV